MTKQKRKILMTTALPYANGSIHLGHMLEHIQADIWARFQKQQGHECYFISADDTHGTPIMLKAQSMCMSPEQLIQDIQKEHERDLQDLILISIIFIPHIARRTKHLLVKSISA